MLSKIFPKIILLTMNILIAFCFAANAQPKAEKKTQLTFPIIPVIAEYEYQAYFFAQWISNHPQYSRIEATVDDLEKAASLQIVLVESETGKRVSYCTSDEQTKTLQAEGKEVYLTRIDFKRTQEADRQPTYGFGFRDKRGQAILWRVIPATRPSERGRELIPAASFPGLRLEYRDLATAVGEGTAIQIGDQVVEAEPWREISSPPYFVAYRGTVAVGRHFGSLLLGARKWQVITRPPELREGAEWIVSDESGRKRAFKVIARNNSELIINELRTNSTSLSFIVKTNDSQEFGLRSVRLHNNSQTMQIRFEPELPLNLSVSGKFETAFAISQGKYENIVSGTVSVEQLEGKLRLRWQPRAPGWTKTRALETLIKFETNGYELETTQAAK